MNISNTNPIYLSWRTFEGLDLALSSKQTKPIQSNFYYTKKAPHEKIEHYIASREFVGKTFAFPFPPWSNAKPIFEAIPIRLFNYELKSIEQLAQEIEPDIQSIRENVDFNGMNFLSDYIDFYQREKKEKPQDTLAQIFHRFQPNLKEEVKKYQGTACVGKAWEIQKRLQQKGIGSHIVVELEGHKQIAIHAAVVVPCQIGALLIEIEQNPPIIPLQEGEPFIQSALDSSISFELKYDENDSPFIKKTDISNKKTSTYPLFPVTNPDECVMKRCLIETPFYPISTGKRAGKPLHALQVNFALAKITFNVNGKKFRFPLAAINKDALITREPLCNEAGEMLSPTSASFFLIPNKEGELRPGPFFTEFMSDPKELIELTKKVTKFHRIINKTRKLLGKQLML